MPRPTLWGRLKKKKLIQWALAYSAGAFFVYNGLDPAREAWGIPEAVIRVAHVLLITGFMITLVLAWYHGEKGQQRVSWPELLMVCALLAVAGLLVPVVWDGGQRLQPEDLVGSDEVNTPSIAVLPFDDLGDRPGEEYLAPGLTEELWNRLAAIPQLRLAPRTSAFALKGSGLPVDSIASRLQVTHVLEGTVQRAGERLRISASLIEARSNREVWTARYEERMRDWFEIEDQVSAAIAQELHLRLAGPGRENYGTVNEQAHDSYLRGLHRFNLSTEPDLRRAIDHFNDALGHDSTYAAAWVGIALAHTMLADAYMAPVEANRLAEVAADKALAVGDLPEARVIKAYVDLTVRFDPSRALAGIDSVLAVRPGDSFAAMIRAISLDWLGRPEEAQSTIRRALSNDPFSLVLYHVGSFIYALDGRWQEAEALYRGALDIEPSFFYIDSGLGYTYLATEQWDLARAEYDRARRTWSAPMVGEAILAARTGNIAEAQRILSEFETLRSVVYVQPSALARIHAVLGNEEGLIEELGRAIEARDAWLYWVVCMRSMDPYRDDPRFAEILREIGRTRCTAD
jgi:TolB-like protein/Tfp pilus assembly protein PilF